MLALYPVSTVMLTKKAVGLLFVDKSSGRGSMVYLRQVYSLVQFAQHLLEDDGHITLVNGMDEEVISIYF